MNTPANRPDDGLAGGREASSGEDPLQESAEVSLDELSNVYAELLDDEPGSSAVVTDTLDTRPLVDAIEQLESDVGLSPSTILEAMLFVGHPENQPLKPDQVTRILRGVSAEELPQFVQQLNEIYQQSAAPYAIVERDGGYLLELRPEMGYLREKFYRKVKQRKLSQAAIDVMAIVAYHQGTTREQVDHLRDRASSSILAQLVRRKILRAEIPEQNKGKTRYYTADRFLTLFGLESLADLPRAHDLEPMN